MESVIIFGGPILAWLIILYLVPSVLLQALCFAGAIAAWTGVAFALLRPVEWGVVGLILAALITTFAGSMAYVVVSLARWVWIYRANPGPQRRWLLLLLFMAIAVLTGPFIYYHFRYTRPRQQEIALHRQNTRAAAMQVGGSKDARAAIEQCSTAFPRGSKELQDCQLHNGGQVFKNQTDVQECVPVLEWIAREVEPEVAPFVRCLRDSGFARLTLSQQEEICADGKFEREPCLMQGGAFHELKDPSRCARLFPKDVASQAFCSSYVATKKQSDSRRETLIAGCKDGAAILAPCIQGAAAASGLEELCSELGDSTHEARICRDGIRDRVLAREMIRGAR